MFFKEFEQYILELNRFLTNLDWSVINGQYYGQIPQKCHANCYSRWYRQSMQNISQDAHCIYIDNHIYACTRNVCRVLGQLNWNWVCQRMRIIIINILKLYMTWYANLYYVIETKTFKNHKFIYKNKYSNKI